MIRIKIGMLNTSQFSFKKPIEANALIVSPNRATLILLWQQENVYSRYS